MISRANLSWRPKASATAMRKSSRKWRSRNNISSPYCCDRARLFNVFDKLGLIENFGTGIPRTLEAYAPFGEKPIFKPSDNFFIVHLPNLNSPQRKQSDTGALNDQINDRLNDVCLGILRFVKNHPGSRIDEIASGIKDQFGPQTADAIYNQIKRYLRDYLEFRGPKKSDGYHMK